MVLIGGVKRTGTSLMRNLVGSHSDIAIPPVEFGFFTDYRHKDFATDDGYARAIARFRSGSRPERWALRDETIAEDGHTARDFYCAALNAYRRSNKPEARFFGDKSTFIEFEFDTYREWFGLERIRFIHMVRNPFDCYASTKSIPHLTHWPSYALYHFCDSWARSMVLGLSLAQRFPSSYRMVRYEDLVADPAPVVADLCKWIGVEDETQRMLAAADYDRKSNSSFGDIAESADENASNVVNLTAGSRLKHLNAHEIRTIRRMTAGPLLSLLHYDIVGGVAATPDALLIDSARQYLNLTGLRGGIPAYFRLIGAASGTLLSIMVDRIRGR
jgi:hypothetical protein